MQHVKRILCGATKKSRSPAFEESLRIFSGFTFAAAVCLIAAPTLVFADTAPPAAQSSDEKKDEGKDDDADPTRDADERKERQARPIDRPRVTILRRNADPDRFADPMLATPIPPTLQTGSPAPDFGWVEDGSSLAPPPDRPGNAPAPRPVTPPTAPTIEKPQVSARAAHGRGGWYVQVGAFASPQSARSRLDAAVEALGPGAEDAQATLALADLAGAALYRARFSGVSEARAIALCDLLKRKGFDCFAAALDGW